jgi:hypothetical protein
MVTPNVTNGNYRIGNNSLRDPRPNDTNSNNAISSNGILELRMQILGKLPLMPTLYQHIC